MDRKPHLDGLVYFVSEFRMYEQTQMSIQCMK